jgi:AmiR/NasT family two-component response regulator
MRPSEERNEGQPTVAESLADAEREIKQLQQAVESRTMIGQAEGILMERFGLNAAQAFDYLRRVSSHSNRKVVDIAARIVETGELPEY